MGADGRECIFEVIQEYVELRGKPSLDEEILGQMDQGSKLQGTVHQIGEEPWLQVSMKHLSSLLNVGPGEGVVWTPVKIVMSFGSIEMLQFVEQLPEPVQAETEEERCKREQEEGERARLLELQEKAMAAEALVREASQLAQELLASPLEYEVLTGSPTFMAPLPLAESGSSVGGGQTLKGYPGSTAWVRVLLPSVGPGNGPERWLPARGLQSREPVLRACWPQLSATKVSASAIELSWPGVSPKRPCTAEYVVEWRQKSGSELPEAPQTKGGGRATSSKASAKVTGLPAASEVQLRVSVRVAKPGQGQSKGQSQGQSGGADLKLSGPWMDFETADPSASEGEGLYEVLNKFLMLRCEPSRKGRACGTLKMGHQVYGTPFSINEEPWIKLSPQPMPEGRDVLPEDSYWALVDASGTDLGLGVLMKRVRDGGPSAEAKPGLWKVLHERVAVRAEASTEATALGFHRKGESVRGACALVGGCEWLRVLFAPAAGAKEQEGWMLVNGQKLGLGALLERVGDADPDAQAKAKAASSRSMPKRPKPPRPLTAPWLAAHGNLSMPPSAVREELLPESEDVGMASQCSLVWVTPGDSDQEQCFVAKRAVENGDLSTAWKEFRFYAEVVKKAPPGQPTFLEGDLQVPRCLVANWKDGGGKDEREHFLILMERLDKPDWRAWNVSRGISEEQALAAVRALGRFHKAYESESLLQPLDWLGKTRFGLDHLDGLQHFYGIQLNLHRGVISRILSKGAMEAAESLSISPHVVFVCQMLAEPPLTLCHGDYRPENLRFSAPGKPEAVAVFDWGLANVGRGLDDFCYFLMLCQPPDKRREREAAMLWCYLEARGWKTDEDAMEAAQKDVKAAALAILAMILMTRLQTQNAGFFQGTRDMLTRMLTWTGQAIEDWKAYDILPYYTPSAE